MRATLIVALLAGALAAPEPEPKKITVELKNVPLAALAQAVARQAGVAVEVAEEVAARRVTVVLVKVTAKEALEHAAASAGTTLSRGTDGSFRLGPAKPSIDARIRKILAETKVNVKFDGTSLGDALGFYSNMAGVTMVVDPHVLATRKPDTLEMNLTVNQVTVAQLLALTSELLNLAYDVRWGLVLVSTKARLAALPRTVLPPTPTGNRSEGEKALRRRLAEESVGFDFAETPLPMVVQFIGMMRKLPIRWDADARKAAEKMTVTLRLSDISIDRALAVLLYTNGLDFEVTKDAVVVRLMRR